jgi:hypothetical protein
MHPEHKNMQFEFSSSAELHISLHSDISTSKADKQSVIEMTSIQLSDHSQAAQQDNQSRQKQNVERAP